MICIGTVFPSSPPFLRKFKKTEKYKKYDKISIYHNPELSSILIYIYIYLQSLLFLKKWTLTYKMKSPLTNPHSTPPKFIPFPSSLFTGNHYQEFGLYPSNPFQKHFKNIHTYVSVTNI